MKTPSKKVQAFLWQLVGFALGMLMIFSFLLTSGCAVIQTQPSTGCPAGMKDRIQSRMVVEQCTGNSCELLMTVCMVSNDKEEPLFQ